MYLSKYQNCSWVLNGDKYRLNGDKKELNRNKFCKLSIQLRIE